MNNNSKLIEEFIFQLRKAENTKKAYQRDLEIFNWYLSKVDVSINHVSHNTIQMFIENLEAGTITNKDGKRYSPSSINRVYAAIRVYCQYSNQFEAIKDDIRINKPAHISQQSPKSIEKDAIETIRSQVCNSRKASSQRDTAILDMLKLTGMRVSELVNLTKDDIIYDKKSKYYSIHINSSKGNKARIIPINKDRFSYIKGYLDSRTDDVEYVFINHRNKQLTTRAIQLLLKEYDVTPHMLRHSFCTSLARNGNDLSMIANLAGHSIAVAQRYTVPTEKHKADAIDRALSLD